MRCTVLLLMVAVFFTTASSGQSPNKPEDAQWSFNGELNAYALPDLFFFMPVMRSDKGHLHLEARYNYEDLNTFSAWAGYNFSGGNRFAYTFTPMFGGVVGRTNGFAPGLEMTLEFADLEFYSESEYLVDVNSSADNYFYNFSDFTYAPADWLWFGLSVQRTRLVDSGLVVERGFLLGSGWKNWEITAYGYNLFTVDTFVFVTVAAAF